MHDLIVILRFPESDWGEDLVCFHLPDSCTPTQLMDELIFSRSDLAAEDFDTRQDLADALCTLVAQELGGSWNYVAQCGAIDIRED